MQTDPTAPWHERSAPSRAFLGTEYTTLDLEAFSQALVHLGVRQFAGQIERCPKSKRLHIQYAIRFPNPRALSGILSLRKFSWLKPSTSWTSALKYVTKDDTRATDQANHGPLLIGCSTLTSAKHLQAQVNAHILSIGADAALTEGSISLLQYQRVLQATTVHQLRTSKPPSVSSLTNEWYYGSTGTGKSRKARETYPDAFIKQANKWWDGYAGQEVVIVEDLAPVHHVLRTHILHWSDHYPFSAEVKGSSLLIRPKKIIVTSNYHPKEIWNQTDKDSEPFERRFNLTKFIAPLI